MIKKVINSPCLKILKHWPPLHLHRVPIISCTLRGHWPFRWCLGNKGVTIEWKGQTTQEVQGRPKKMEIIVWIKLLLSFNRLGCKKFPFPAIVVWSSPYSQHWGLILVNCMFNMVILELPEAFQTKVHILHLCFRLNFLVVFWFLL